MAHLPLKWRNEDPVAFARCINASAICFTDLLAHELVTKTLEVRLWVSRKGKMKGIAEKWKETKDVYMNQEWRWKWSFFPIWCNFVGRSVRMGRFGHLFPGKSSVNSTGLCLRENQQWFFEKKLLNLCSLYLGSCSFGLWLPSTPQFGDLLRCNGNKWSCAVVGSHRCLGANGRWNLFRLDFRRWTLQPLQKTAARLLHRP